MDSPSEPFVQLLNILPPQSFHLLPEKLGKVLTKNEKYRDYFPTEIEIDCMNRRFFWECNPVLIDIPQGLVEQVCHEVLNTLTSSEKCRNTIRSDQDIN